MIFEDHFQHKSSFKWCDVVTRQFSPRTRWSHLLLAKMSPTGDMFVRATGFSYFDFFDFDGLINPEVGNKNVRRSETERLRRTRASWESTS